MRLLVKEALRPSDPPRRLPQKIRDQAIRNRQGPGCQRDHHLSQREALQKDRDGGAPEIRTKKPTK